MAECLVQARFSPQTWADGTTTDSADVTMAADLVAVLENLGARFQGIWFSFGEGEYDLVAIVDVPASVDVAALTIAARIGWDGAPFDKICITPLLNQGDAALAWDCAVKALATTGDATSRGPLSGSAAVGRNADSSPAGQAGTTNAEAVSEFATLRRDRPRDGEITAASRVPDPGPEFAVDRPSIHGVDDRNANENHGSVFAVVPRQDRGSHLQWARKQATQVDQADVVPSDRTEESRYLPGPRNGQVHESIRDHQVEMPDGGDVVVDGQNPPPPAATTPPPQAPQRRWWKTPAGAGAVAVALAVLGVGGYFGVNAMWPSRSMPAAPPPVASRVPDYLPLGAVACQKVYNDVHLPFDAGARGTPTTSCPFVEQVRRTYSQLSATSAPTDQIRAISPSTEKWYALACIPTGNYVTCTGGAAAVIYLYNSSHQ